MDEQTSWKGHSFTLLVFAGIVVLCSIFFILGMLVGRTQGEKMARAAAREKQAAIPQAKPDRPELTPEDSVEKDKPPALETASPPAEQPPRPPAMPLPTEAARALGLQVGAMSRASEAEKLLQDVRAKGFSGFIMAPAPGDPVPLYRVQVGPFTDETEANQVRRRLEAAGYKPIIKK